MISPFSQTTGRWRIALAAVLLAPLVAPVAMCQSIGGATGLVFVPTARTQTDGTLAIGAGYVSDTYSDYLDGAAYLPVYASIAFLPTVEVGFRFSRAVDTGIPQALGDRMLFARVRLLEERGAVPALAVGAHDFLRSSSNLTNQFAALYAVASKAVTPGPLGLAKSLDLHLGVGTDWIGGEDNQFVGPFGGLAIVFVDTDAGLFQRVETLVEYDGRTVNVGQRIGLGNDIALTAALQGLAAPTVGIAARRAL